MAKKLPSWRITVIRKKGEYLGTVAIKEFGITDPQRRRRLSAQRVN